MCFCIATGLIVFAAISLFSACKVLSEPVAISRDSSCTVELSPGVMRIKAPLKLKDILHDFASSAAAKICGSKNGETRINGSGIYRARLPFPDESLPIGVQRSEGLLIVDADKYIRELWIAGDDFGLGCSPKSFISLFQTGKRLKCASWPKSGYAQANAVSSSDPKNLVFTASVEQSRHWSNSPSLTIAGYFGFDWFYETVGVKSVNPGGMVSLLPLKQPYPAQFRFRYSVRGDPFDLNEPGEYILDPTGGRIFFIGFAGAPPEIEIPIAQSLLTLDSETNLTLINLVFEMSSGNAIEVKNSQNITFQDINVRHVNRNGISVSGGKNVKIERAVVSDIGYTGISLVGGNRETLQAGGHSVRYSVIHSTSVIQKTYEPAVNLEGVGNILEDSYISDLPHTAVIYSGNEHRVKHNEITRVLLETSDAGAIYSGRDWTWRGNAIVGNYLHNLLPMADDEPKRVGENPGN